MTIGSLEGVSCSTCFYGIRARNTMRAEYQCRRFPPGVTSRGEGSSAQTWPAFVPGDFACGEWHTDQEPPASMGLAEVPPGAP